MLLHNGNLQEITWRFEISPNKLCSCPFLWIDRKIFFGKDEFYSTIKIENGSTLTLWKNTLKHRLKNVLFHYPGKLVYQFSADVLLNSNKSMVCIWRGFLRDLPEGEVLDRQRLKCNTFSRFAPIEEQLILAWIWDISTGQKNLLCIKTPSDLGENPSWIWGNWDLKLPNPAGTR